MSMMLVSEAYVKALEDRVQAIPVLKARILHLEDYLREADTHLQRNTSGLQTTLKIYREAWFSTKKELEELKESHYEALQKLQKLDTEQKQSEPR